MSSILAVPVCILLFLEGYVERSCKGTGKSVLLREIIKTLRKKHTQDAVAITASTGERVF